MEGTKIGTHDLGIAERRVKVLTDHIWQRRPSSQSTVGPRHDHVSIHESHAIRHTVEDALALKQSHDAIIGLSGLAIEINARVAIASQTSDRIERRADEFNICICLERLLYRSLPRVAHPEYFWFGTQPTAPHIAVYPVARMASDGLELARFEAALNSAIGLVPRYHLSMLCMVSIGLGSSYINGKVARFSSHSTMRC